MPRKFQRTIEDSFVNKAPAENASVLFKDSNVFLTIGNAKLEIPRLLGKKIQLLLGLEEELQKNNPDKKLIELHKSFNCHKTIFYLLDLMDAKNLTSKEEREKRYAIQLLNDKNYSHYEDVDTFENSVREKLGNSIGVIQEIEQSKYNHGLVVRHSFLVGANDKGRIICFEKMDSGGGAAFQIIGLDKLYDRAFRYGVVKIEDIDRKKLAKDIRNYNEIENSANKEFLSREEEMLDRSYGSLEGYPKNGSYEDKFKFVLKFQNE